MKSLKEVFNQNKIIIGLALGILFCVLGMVISSERKEPEDIIKQNTSAQIQEIEEEETIAVYYEEKDDTKGYNYIVNPQTLADMGIYVVHIQDIPDEINRVLTEKGYSGEKLKIRDARQSGTKVKFDIVVLSDNSKYACEYSLRFGTFAVN